MFLKVIACEIAVRELQYAAARSRNLIDLEFLTQGHHDTPASGRQEIQQRIGQVVKLPQGYRIEYGGQFESAERAYQRLMLLGIGVIAGTGADELMITANIFDHEKRKRSFEIVAEVHGGMTRRG